MTKKNGLYQLKLRQRKAGKIDHFLVKQGHINKDIKKNVKQWKLKIMTKAKPVIMTNKMNIPYLCQIRKMFRTKLKKMLTILEEIIYFFMAKVQQKPTKGRTDYSS